MSSMEELGVPPEYCADFRAMQARVRGSHRCLFGIPARWWLRPVLSTRVWRVANGPIHRLPKFLLDPPEIVNDSIGRMEMFVFWLQWELAISLTLLAPGKKRESVQ